MASRLRTAGVWPRITELATRAKRAHVAVAYFSKANILPLPAGSILVCDASKKALGQGQTNPTELLKLINKGVEVHSVANLHAKVFVFDGRAVIGSANASASSSKLLEAIVETTEKMVVSSATAFVRSLRGDHIGPKYAERLKRDYRPPKGGSGGGGASPSKLIPKHSAIWIAPLYPQEWSDVEEDAAQRARPVARKRLRSTRLFEVAQFSWPSGDKMHDHISVGHRLVQVDHEDGRVMVSAPMRVVHVRKYRDNGAVGKIVSLECPKKVRRRSIVAIRKQTGSLADELGKPKVAGKLLRDVTTIYALGRLWPSVYPE